MSKDKYTDLVGHPGVRVRVERLDGQWSRAAGNAGVRWWDRELIACITTASPRVADIVDASNRLMSALQEIDLDFDVHAHMLGDAEVVMYHGTFVKICVWFPPGTAARLGIKGYGPKDQS